MKFKNELKIIQKNVQQTGIYQLREREQGEGGQGNDWWWSGGGNVIKISRDSH